MGYVSDLRSLTVGLRTRAAAKLRLSDDRRFTEHGNRLRSQTGVSEETGTWIGMDWASVVHIDCSGVLGIREAFNVTY
jgi:hypothetical protein